MCAIFRGSCGWLSKLTQTSETLDVLLWSGAVFIFLFYVLIEGRKKKFQKPHAKLEHSSREKTEKDFFTIFRGRVIWLNGSFVWTTKFIQSSLRHTKKCCFDFKSQNKNQKKRYEYQGMFNLNLAQFVLFLVHKLQVLFMLKIRINHVDGHDVIKKIWSRWKESNA